MPLASYNYSTIDADVRECTSCGDEFDRDYGGTFCEYYEEWLCDSCGPCDCDSCYEERQDSRIHSYSYRPQFMPKGNASEVMMGVELEVGDDQEAIADVVESIDAYENHLYCKEDSSIDGAEIVTHPMTLAYAQQYPFDDMLAGLRGSRCYVNDGYGLHVHVARDSFRQRTLRLPQGIRNGSALERQYRELRGLASPVHTMIWLMFIQRNAEALQKLARRTNDEWASFRRPQRGETRAKATGSRRWDRYLAVNCNNRATFELRFFQATLSTREFYAALEFADASVRYTADLASADVLAGALSWERFTQWATEQGYKNLVAEIIGRPTGQTELF